MKHSYCHAMMQVLVVQHGVVPAVGILECLVVPFVAPMGAGQCGNDRPGFGVHSITQKLSAFSIIRVLNIIKLKLYNII